MSKTKRIAIFAVIVALILATPIVIFFTIDINNYKTLISDAVQSSTGRKLEIKGRLERSVFPRLGLTINNTRLGNPADFDEKNNDEKSIDKKGLDKAPFLEVATLHIYIQVMPLFSQKLVIDTIVLQGLQVNLQQTAEGKNNWTFSKANVQADTQLNAQINSPQDATTPTQTSADPSAPSLAALSVAGLKIVDARVHWQDDKTKSTVTADKLNVNLSAIQQNQPISLELSSHVRNKQADSATELDAEIALKSIINVDIPEQRYQASIKSFTLTARGDLIPNKQQTVNLNAQMEFDGKTQLINISQLTVASGELHISGKLHQTRATSSQFQGQLKIDSFNLKNQLQTLGITLPKDMPDEALNKLDLLADFKIDEQQARIPKLLIHLDESTLSGELAQFVYASQYAKWQLELDQINLNRYLPATDHAANPTSQNKPGQDNKSMTPNNPAGETSDVLPVTLLQGLNQDGQLKIGKLVSQNITTNDIQIGIKANKGDINIRPFKAALYDGAIDGVLGLNVQGKSPKLSIKQNISSLLLGKLLTDAINYDNISEQTVSDIKIDIQSTGNNVDAWTQNLKGTAQFQLRDGAINDINISQKFQDTYRKLKKEPLDTSKFKNQTVFNTISGTLQIDKGVIHNKDLKATSKELDATGSGTIDLPKQSINYVAKASIENLPPGWTRDNLSALIGKKIPITIKGPLLNPDINYIDGVKSVFIDVAKEKLNKAVSREKEKIKKETKEVVDKKVDAEKQRLEEKIEKEKQRLKDRLKNLF